MGKFWQSFSLVTVDLTKWISFVPVHGTDKLRAIITIPVFSVPSPIWLGASYITLEFRANFRENFSILRPVKRPLNSNFILAVRSVHDYVDPSNYELERYKFWNITSPIPGELPSWGLYTGQTLCKSFALEIWTVEGQQFTSQTAPLVLETSILVNAEECCDVVQEEIPVTEVCNLFAELPLDI